MKFHSVTLLLTLAFSYPALAQRAAKSFLIEADDTAVVYTSRTFLDFTQRLMCERPHRHLTDAERDSLNAWFTKLHSETVFLHGALNEKALFIEVRPKEEDRCGLFIVPEGIRLVSEDSPYARYALFPKEVKECVRRFIEQLFEVMPAEMAYSRYDHLPMCCNVSHGRPVEQIHSERALVWFYVRTDSSTINPIEYTIAFSKKKGVKRVVRDVPQMAEMPYAGTNAQGRFLIRRPFGRVATLGKQTDRQAENYINRYIPNWSRMSDRERMRWLDDWIIGHNK